MYVFGVDLPIMELLFLFGIILVIFGILMVVTLIVIWTEIKKLRELILTERLNIYRFEEDITELEPKEKKQHYKKLDEFIKVALEKGFTKKTIKSILIKKGWPKDFVDEALNKN